MSFITGNFVMEVPEDARGQDIEDVFNEIQEKYNLNVLKWK